MIPMDGNICTPKVRSKWFSFNNVRAIFKISSCLNLNILLNKIISHFTIIPAFHPLPLPASQREHIRYVQSRVCIVSCIIVSCMIVLLVRGVRGDCSGPSDGNCARISEETRRGRIGLHTLHSAPPRVRVLGCRCSVTIRGPGPSHWTRPFIRTSGTRPGCSSETRSKF